MNVIRCIGFTVSLFAICSLEIQAGEQEQSGEPPASKASQSKKIKTGNTVSAAPSQAGVVVVKDPDTGQLRQATPEEIGALSRAVNASPAANSPAVAPVVQRPDGFTSMRLGPDQMSFTVLTKSADGKLVESCVTGEDAAKKAVAGVLQQLPNRKEKPDDK